MMAFNDTWRVPQFPLALEVGDVHVWRADLDQPDAVLGQLESFLSVDEQARANRFHFERDRGRFVAGRGVLRAIIGTYLDVRPEQVMFRYGQRGKPALAMPLAQGVSGVQGELRFNVSHSHDLALFAFARGQEIGVDLERVRPIVDAEQIAQ
ncbi:MAG: 4'-phosphopantetheinyl transferase, partial [Chloroflexi bacterium]|nr:4'-phosphopantetheinyl transferase [Chloroflexota bacterium]